MNSQDMEESYITTKEKRISKIYMYICTHKNIPLYDYKDVVFCKRQTYRSEIYRVSANWDREGEVMGHEEFIGTESFIC